MNLTIGMVLQALLGALQFPEAVYRLILLLRKTPEEKHLEIINSIELEAQKFEETGRPEW